MLVLPSCTVCQIRLHIVTCPTSFRKVFHLATWKLKPYIDPPTLDHHHEAYSCHQHCWSRVIWPLGKAAGEVEAPPPSELSHLRAPVKLPQFLSVQCRPAHFSIEGCSEVQECRGAQCASVFGLTQKCFSWPNSLVLRSSYNKLKGPNCPQGRGLATIDMWWDKSPVLIPQHPHPSPDRRDEHVSSVCFAVWVKRPQVRDSIYTVRCGVQLNNALECLQMTSDPEYPVSLYILFKEKGQNQCAYQIISMTKLSFEPGKDRK